MDTPDTPCEGAGALPRQSRPFPFWPRLAGAAVSGAILFSAFPPAEQADAAWIALVPLLCATRGAGARRGALLGLVAGLVFWPATLSWLAALGKNGGPLFLICLGGIALSAYCALYMAWFGALDAWAWRRLRLGRNAWTRAAAALLVEPLLWTGCEYARGVILTGFPWNSLGASQYANLPFAQAAAVGGVPAVTFLLVAMNASIASVATRAIDAFRAMLRRNPGAKVRLLAPELLACAIAVCAVCLWGARRVRAWTRAERDLPACTVALVQPYTPSIFELSDEALAASVDEALGYTACAAAARPDLVVWPESSLPGTLPYDPVTVAAASNLAATAGADTLVGILEFEPGPGWETMEGARFYNSAFLFGADGSQLGRYRKQHLVPFGEFMPLEGIFPALKRLLPLWDSCTPGEGAAVMDVKAGGGSSAIPASPLICFEDTMPYLARRAANAGARMLVNQSNDAWFDGSCEPRQHLAQAVFRAIENGVPLVRSANGGISGVVDAVGRTSLLASEGKDSGFAGFMVARAVAPPADRAPTFYTRFGDWSCGIPALCAAALCTVAGLAGFLPRRRH